MRGDDKSNTGVIRFFCLKCLSGNTYCRSRTNDIHCRKCGADTPIPLFMQAVSAYKDEVVEARLSRRDTTFTERVLIAEKIPPKKGKK